MIGLATSGCVSLQYLGANGKPQVLGFGRAKPLPCAQGELYQVLAPGLCLRWHHYAPGLSCGWSKLLLFYPAQDGATNTIPTPLALQTTCAGLDLAPWHVMLGFERTFQIPLPPSGTGVVQFISYSASHPNATIITRKETR